MSSFRFVHFEALWETSAVLEPFKVSNSLINIEEQQMTIKNQNLMFRVMQENYPKNL